MRNLDVDGLASFLLRIVAVFICIVIHEVSHGFAAYKLGDPTAKQEHRLSLNPLRHIDPVGLLMMVLVGFGWAKPVPINPGYFKNPKSGMAITALAGPLSNFILAFITAMGLHAAYAVVAVNGVTVFLAGLMELLLTTTMLSIGLGIFNLIPFPPLDGSKILGVLLPERLYFRFMRYERYGMLVLFAVLWLGILDAPLVAARSWMQNFIFSNTAFVQEFVFSLISR